MLRCSKADFEEVDFSCGNPIVYQSVIMPRAELRRYTVIRGVRQANLF